MLSMTLCRVSTMKGRVTAMMPMITAFSVNMISSGSSIRPSPIQHRVQEAPVAEHDHPAGRAHGVADEQRQHDRDDQEVLEAALRARHDIGERKAQDQAGRRHRHGDAAAWSRGSAV